jgi:hypothetical protein
MRMPKKIFIQSACYINIYKMCKISVIYTWKVKSFFYSVIFVQSMV